jgi:hypothetical protein
VRDDFNMVFKAMFRPRGESQRVSIADAMGREPYEKIGFGTQFAEAVASVRYCLKIRNQYAHCYWTDNYGKELGFVELEDTADKNSVVANFYTIPTNPLDAPLLDKQEAFFVYARDCLLYLEDQALIQAGKRTSQQWPQAPKKVQPPPLCKP